MGYMHIYTGEGKGKTTAAVGLAVRAAGAGLKVCFIQFCKGNKSSEIEVLDKIENINTYRCSKNYGFYKNMSDDDKLLITVEHNDLLKLADEVLNKGNADLIILDEFNLAYKRGLFDVDLAKKVVNNAKNKVEIVLTGRDADEYFMNIADYISRIDAVKHPYQNGINARKGIEF